MDRPGLEVAVITGLSGAGKSEAVATFEDMGYFCIDNLPPQMLPRAIELFGLEGSRVDKAALVFDVRGGAYFDELGGSMTYLRESGISVPAGLLGSLRRDPGRTVSIHASPPPAVRGRDLVEGIRRERRLLDDLKSQADIIIDTSRLSPRGLRRRLEETLLADELTEQLFLSLTSFGYKYGLPEDADMVFDARFLPNPHWIAELRPLTGRDEAVKEFVLRLELAELFLTRWQISSDCWRRGFWANRSGAVVLAVGCTGGRHRSVVLVEELANRLPAGRGARDQRQHRDVDLGA